MSSILSVSQLNRYISFKLKEDKKLHGILVKGEISNFTNHSRTGHFYFTLKDNEGAVKAVMFNSMASRLKFMPYDGMSVIVAANVQVYERDGVYQLYVVDIQPDGIGALYLKVEQLKEKLMQEGIFEESIKKPLPAFPEKIGIVTSPEAAALQDILKIISRRYPIAEIIIFPALVQGENAPSSVCNALKKADAYGVDVIIAGRGGGSFEDLMAFNSEEVARCIFSCSTPVISAVGHETDNTVADLAADLRAPTPSAAAELAVPDISVMTDKLEIAEGILKNTMLSFISAKRYMLDSKEKQLMSRTPAYKTGQSKRIVEEKSLRLVSAYKNMLSRKKMLISERAAALDNLSPIKIMNRGYSLVYSEKKLVSSAKSLKEGDSISVRFTDGVAEATINKLNFPKGDMLSK